MPEHQNLTKSESGGADKLVSLKTSAPVAIAMEKSGIAAVVIDNGTYMCRSGISGDQIPKKTLRTVTGLAADSEDLALGQEALQLAASKENVTVSRPIQHGLVMNWDHMEKIWKHLFKSLSVSSDEYPVLLTEVPFNPKANREKMTQIMFETFSTPAMYSVVGAVLALYATGHTSGVVLDSGEDVSFAVPVVEGYAKPQGIKKDTIGGLSVNAYLEKLLNDAGQAGSLAALGASAKGSVLDKLKEKLCYVSMDAEQEMKKVGSSCTEEFELPDGSKISVGPARFQCTEVLFQPSLLQHPTPGLASLIHQCISAMGADLSTAVHSKIVLSGGNTMFPGTKERMLKEMASLSPLPSKEQTVIDIVAPENRSLCAWIGGSILASLSTFKDMWMTSKEYQEVGPALVHKKCK